MDRRRFLTGLAGAALLGPPPSRAAAGCPTRVAVATDDPGQPVAADFVGLSYESALVAAKNYFTPVNHSLIGLIRRLGSDGVIRIGGNTSERTVWWTESGPAPAESHVITPSDIDRLAATMQAIGWRLIYGLNLARGTPEQAAAEAAYVAHRIGPRLLAFQIGNEPDGFGRWSAVRPRSYDFAAFLAEWRPFRAAIRAKVPNAPIAGPDVAAETDWVPAFAEAAPEGLVLLTRHYYSDGPASDPHVTLAKLLRSAPQVEPILATLEQASRRYRLPWRIAETNSVFQGGRPGVSDTLGAALWGAELMFQIAAAGGAGINFHGGDDKVYTPIAGGGSRPFRAQPLYYGMLLFVEACRGRLLPTQITPGSGDLAAFAAREGHALRVALINKAPSQSQCVALDPGRRVRDATVIRLAGPSPDATAGVTFGGTVVDAFGGWVPAHREPVRIAHREIALDLPATSAALVTLRT